MSTPRTQRSENIDPSELLDTLAELYEADETVSLGGVTAKRIADEMGFTATPIRKLIRRLRESGEVEKVYGFEPSQGPISSYRPAGDRE